MNISIIVPFYNSEKTLGLCLDAATNQTKSAHEIILVDDKSDDGSVNIAKSYNVKVISLTERSGPAVARNTGAIAATGEVLLFLDSDVVMPANCIEKIAQNFSDKGCDAVQTLYSPKTTYPKLATDYQQVLYTYQFMQIPETGSSIFTTYCAAVKKDVFVKIGMFNMKIKKASAEDAELGHLLAGNGYSIYVDKNLYVAHHTDYTFMKFFSRRHYIVRDLIKSYLQQIILITLILLN